MTEPVKTRSYQSPLREEQAARTRARILEAARPLFERDGFARTSVKAIASAAHVAPDTVYAIFGSKSRILTALIDHELAPSEDDSAVTERAEARAVRDELDQRQQIHLFARDIAAVVERVRPIHEILQTAAAVDPKMQAISLQMENYRLTEIRKVAAWLASRGRLRVDPERAAEIIWALASPSLSRMLCEIQQWSLDHYSAWLEDTLVRTLLDEDVPGVLPPTDAPVEAREKHRKKTA